MVDHLLNYINPYQHLAFSLCAILSCNNCCYNTSLVNSSTSLLGPWPPSIVSLQSSYLDWSHPSVSGTTPFNVICQKPHLPSIIFWLNQHWASTIAISLILSYPNAISYIMPSSTNTSTHAIQTPLTKPTSINHSLSQKLDDFYAYAYSS